MVSPRRTPLTSSSTRLAKAQYYLAGLSQASYLLGDETTGRAVQVVGVTTGVRRAQRGGVAHQQTSGAERQEETVVRIEGDRVGPFDARSRRRPRSVSWNDRLQAVQGEWSAAEDGLRRVIADAPTRAGCSADRPFPRWPCWRIGRVAPRRDALAGARESAEQAQNLHALVPTAVALAERGWLTSDPARGDLARTLLPRLEAAAASGSAVS